MKNGRIKWYIVNKEYVDYLKRYDEKIQNINYKNSSKPYIGIILSINNFDYYVPISSAKPKHYSMNENTDFVKITDGNKILSAINLNNMIPIFESDITMLNYGELSRYFLFKDKTSELKYISLLRREIFFINNRSRDLLERAKSLYEIKYNTPYTSMARRCCDFNLLEEKCIEYNRTKAILPNLKNINNIEDLYYIYDNLDNQDLFEDVAVCIDSIGKNGNIQKMGKTEINSALNRWVEESWTYGLSREYLLEHAQDWYNCNEMLKVECPKYGIKYIDTSKDREKVLAKILAEKI